MTRVQPVDLPPQLLELQQVYEEKQVEAEQLSGEPRPPRCPQCGHHTINVKMHRSAAAV